MQLSSMSRPLAFSLPRRGMIVRSVYLLAITTAMFGWIWLLGSIGFALLKIAV